jgi:hypothetical protein|uniref:hypothetical protein n=1 Tax=Phocaeicola vulgatus TaxID=821 RepID=UPI0040262F5A
MEHQIRYRFSKMELEQFAMFEENYNKEVKGAQFQTEAQFSFDKATSVLCCRITVDMSAMEKPLAKIVLKSFFEIHPDSLKLILKDDKIVFPPFLLVQFASLCYGAVRGVLFAKTQDTPLAGYILPPVYFGNLIDKGFEVELNIQTK